MISPINLLHERASQAYYSVWIPRKYRGTLKKRLEWFQANEAKDREEIEALLWSSLRRVLAHAEANVPYYREIFQREGLQAAEIANCRTLTRLPLLEKGDIRENLESLVVEDQDRKALVRLGTGGSTGKPISFYHDQEYNQQNTALILRNQFWTGWRAGEPIIKLWGSAFDIHITAQIKESLVNYVKNETIFPAFEMSPANQLKWLQAIRRIRPTLVIGYTNALAKLAEFSQENHIPLHDIGIKSVVCSAETLLPKHRQLLEKTFNAHIINRYGTRELSTIAHECLFGTLHINEDWVYVEITDDRGRQVPNGQSGQVVLTGLYNDGMPFIRYAIQDIGSYTLKDEPCPCGCKFRALEQVEGRIQDLIVLPEGGYITGLFFPHLFKDYDVRQFQVLQPSLERLEIYLVPGKDFSSEDLESLRQTIARYTPGIQSSFQLVDEIPLTDSGKFRTTISHVAGAHVLHNIQAHEEKTPN